MLVRGGQVLAREPQADHRIAVVAIDGMDPRELEVREGEARVELDRPPESLLRLREAKPQAGFAALLVLGVRLEAAGRQLGHRPSLDSPGRRQPFGE